MVIWCDTKLTVGISKFLECVRQLLQSILFVGELVPVVL